MVVKTSEVRVDSFFDAIEPAFAPKGPVVLLILSVFPSDVSTMRCTAPRDCVPGPGVMLDCKAGRQEGSHFMALKLRCESNTQLVLQQASLD